jgi:hypothetical protein
MKRGNATAIGRENWTVKKIPAVAWQAVRD